MDTKVESFVASPTSPEAVAAQELSAALIAAEAELATPPASARSEEFVVQQEEIEEYSIEDFESSPATPAPAAAPEPAEPEDGKQLEANTTQPGPKALVPLVPLMAAGVSAGAPNPGNGAVTARSSIPSTQRSEILTARSTTGAVCDPHAMTLDQIKKWLRAMRNPQQVQMALDMLPRRMRPVAHETAFPSSKMSSAAAALHVLPMEHLVEMARDASKLGKLLVLNPRLRHWVMKQAGREQPTARVTQEDLPAEQHPEGLLVLHFSDSADRVAAIVANKPGWLVDDLGLKLGVDGASIRIIGSEQSVVEFGVVQESLAEITPEHIRHKLEAKFVAGLTVLKAEVPALDHHPDPELLVPPVQSIINLGTATKKLPTVLSAERLHRMSVEELLNHCRVCGAGQGRELTLDQLPARIRDWVAKQLHHERHAQLEAADQSHWTPLEELKDSLLQMSSAQVMRCLHAANPRVRRWLLMVEPALNQIWETSSGSSNFDIAAAMEARAALRPKFLPGLSVFDWQSRVKVPASTAAIATRDRVLATVIKACDALPLDKYVVHPVVRMSVVHARSGKYLSKPLPDDRAVAFSDGNEAGESRCSHILPLTTQPYHVRPRRTITPVWNETLLINVNASYFLHPDVLFLFEVLDFGHQMQTLAERKPHRVDRDGWYRVAWGFVQPIVPVSDHTDQTGNYNWRLDQELNRVQLYGYSDMPMFQVDGSPEVWQQWKSGYRNKFISTLYVSLGCSARVAPSKVMVDNRAERRLIQTPTEQEVGSMTVKELLKRAQAGDHQQKEEVLDAAARRHRELNEACILPHLLRGTLAAGEFGSNLVCFKLLGAGSGGYLLYSCVGKQQHTVCVMKVNSMQVVYSLPGHLGMIYDMSFDYNERLFVTASADGTAKVWDLEWLHLNHDGSVQNPSNKHKNPMSPPVDSSAMATLAHTSYVYSAKFHPANSGQNPVVFTAGFDTLVRIWDVSSATVLRSLSYHSSWVNSIACSPDGTRIFTAAANGELFVCRFSEHHQPCKQNTDRVRKIEIEDIGSHAISGLRLVSCGTQEYLLVMSRDNKVRVIELCELYTVLRGYHGLQSHKHAVKACVSPDGQWVVSGSDDGRLCIWNSSAGQLVLEAMEQLPRWPNPVYDIAWHPTQHLMAVASYGRGQQVLIFTQELGPDAPRDPIRATLLNARAGHDDQQALGFQSVSGIKHEAAKKKYYDHYMGSIYSETNPF